MKLGSITVKPRSVDAYTAAMLVRAARGAEEPDATLCHFAALGLSCKGPDGWPEIRAGQNYPQFGRVMRGYLQIAGVKPARAIWAGMMALQSMEQHVSIEDEEAMEIADFFGVTLSASASSDDSDSPTDTEGTPSSG